MPDIADEHATPKGVTGSVHLVRAGAVVVCFLVALLLLLGPASRGILAAPGKAHNPTHPIQPVNKSTTRVQVANGSATQGAAGTVSSQLQTLGWIVLPAETAAVHPGHWIVYFAPGHQLAAKEVARSIGVPHQHVVVRTAQIGVRGANQDDVIVVIGHSLRG